MALEQKQPNLYAILLRSTLLCALIVRFSIYQFDPYFLAHHARNKEWIILTIISVAIFITTIIKIRTQDIEQSRVSPKSPPSMGKIFITLALIATIITGFFYLLGKEVQREDAKNINHFQNIATPAMQQECIKECSTYGVTQNELVGPKVEESFCCRGKTGYIHYLFSWHSNKTDVTLKVLISKQNYNSPLIIKPYWIGTTLPNISTNPNNNSNNQPVIPFCHDINSVIHQNESAIKNTYQRALIATPAMHGSYISINLIIAPDGQVKSASIVASDLNSSKLKNNLLNIFRNLKFSSGNFNPENHTYRLYFNKNFYIFMLQT